MLQRAIGEERFAGGFGNEDLIFSKQAVDLVTFFERHEEDLAWPRAPDSQEVVRGEEDGWSVGKGRSEEHGGRSSVYKVDDAAEIKGDGGAVGLVAVEQNLGIGRDGAVVLKLLDL